MPLVSSVDYINKQIFLSVETVGITLDLMDVYREVRERRRTNEDDRKFDPMIVAGGNLEKQAGVFTQPYVQLLFGCEIIPFDATQTLTIIRDTFSDDGRAQAQCYNTSGFTNVVNIVEAVQLVEVREVATGGGTSPWSESEKNNIISNVNSVFLKLPTGNIADQTTVQRLLDIAEGDVIPTETEFQILQRITKAVLVRKDHAVNGDGYSELTETP